MESNFPGFEFDMISWKNVKDRLQHHLALKIFLRTSSPDYTSWKATSTSFGFGNFRIGEVYIETTWSIGGSASSSLKGLMNSTRDSEMLRAGFSTFWLLLLEVYLQDKTGYLKNMLKLFLTTVSYLRILGRSTIVKCDLDIQKRVDVYVLAPGSRLIRRDGNEIYSILPTFKSREIRSQVNLQPFQFHFRDGFTSARNKVDIGFVVEESSTFLQWGSGFEATQKRFPHCNIWGSALVLLHDAMRHVTVVFSKMNRICLLLTFNVNRICGRQCFNNIILRESQLLGDWSSIVE